MMPRETPKSLPEANQDTSGGMSHSMKDFPVSKQCTRSENWNGQLKEKARVGARGSVSVTGQDQDDEEPPEDESARAAPERLRLRTTRIIRNFGESPMRAQAR